MSFAPFIPRCRSCSLPPGTPRFFFEKETDLEALAKLLVRGANAVCFYVQETDEYVCIVSGAVIVLSKNEQVEKGGDPSEPRLPDHPLYRVLHGRA